MCPSETLRNAERQDRNRARIAPRICRVDDPMQNVSVAPLWTNLVDELSLVSEKSVRPIRFLIVAYDKTFQCS